MPFTGSAIRKYMLAFFLVIVLTACSNHGDSTVQSEDIALDDISWNCTTKKVTGWENYTPQLGTFFVADDALYFMGDEKGKTVIAKTSAEASTVSTLYQNESLVGYCVREDGKEIVCCLQNKEETLLTFLDEQGKETYRITIGNDTTNGQIPQYMCIDQKDNLALLFDKNLIIINPNGMDKVKAEVEEIVRGISSSEPGQFVLKVADKQGTEWLESVSAESGEIRRISNPDGVNKFGNYPFSFMDLGITEMDVIGVSESRNHYYVWTWNWMLSSDAPLYCSIISQKNDMNHKLDTVNVLKIVTQRQDQSLDAMAIAYSKEHEGIKIQVEHLSMEDGAWNMRLASRENIDLVLLGTDFGVLQRAGYLQAIDPYLDNWEINKAEIVPAFLSIWQEEAMTYGIPCNINIRVPYLRMDCEIDGALTTKELIDLFQKHPEIKSENGLFSIELLRLCLEGDLTSYLSTEGDLLGFDIDKLRDLCMEINGLSLDARAYYSEFDELIQSGVPLFGEWIVTNPKSVLELFYKMGDSLHLIGYPTEEGYYTTSISSSALCLMKQSKNYDAALDFMRYYYENYRQFYPTETWEITYQQLQKQIEEAIEIDFAQEDYAGIASTYMKESQRIIDGAKGRSPYLEYIIACMNEELSPCFMGDKSFDEALKILNSRLLIYFSE